MSVPKHLVIIAGEESGDKYAAELVDHLKKTSLSLKVTGIGGDHLQEAGAELISDLARHAVTGISEVIRHLGTIKKAKTSIENHLMETKPDLLLLIDYPEFNLRLAKFAKEKLGIRVFYYISPQVWAWKPKRIHHIKKYVDHMAVIFPFEKTLYEASAAGPATMKTSYVGHPLVSRIEKACQVPVHPATLGLPENKRFIALLPGSRNNEIQRLMPIFYETAKILYRENKNLHFVIPVARTIDPQSIQLHWPDAQLPCTFVSERALEVIRLSDLVLVASGTASLECALLEKPMCILYKVSLLTAIVAAKVIRVKYLGLCNLLQNQMIVPEFLQYDCNPQEIARTAFELLQNSKLRQKQCERLKAMKNTLTADQAETSLFNIVYDELKSVKN